MPRHAHVGLSVFAEWEKMLVKGKVQGLIRSGKRYGFGQADREDVEQELFLEVYLKRHTRESWADKNASEETVMSRILDNKIKHMIEASLSAKRKIRLHESSLAEPLRMNRESDDIVTYETLLKEDASLSGLGKIPPAQDEETRLAVDLAAFDLSDLQKRVVALFKSGMSRSEAAIALGMKRTTLNREIDRMRAVLYERKLEDYI